MSVTIGWIGAGVMGRPMASHLLRAGYSVIVAQRQSPGVRALVALGAETASTPREVAARSDVVVTMLPDTAEVEKVALGTDGVSAGIRHGSVFIDMSSIAPAVAKRIAHTFALAGVDALDAPVSGGEEGALRATLSIMVGGTATAHDRALPILQCLGSTVVHVGGPGSGQVAKACNQLVVAVTIEAIAEGLALADAAGGDVVKVCEALSAGLAASRILDRYGPRMIEARYEPGARARLHYKDLLIAAQLADDSGIELPALALARDRFAELTARDGDLDHSALRTIIAAPLKSWRGER